LGGHAQVGKSGQRASITLLRASVKVTMFRSIYVFLQRKLRYCIVIAGKLSKLWLSGSTHVSIKPGAGSCRPFAPQRLVIIYYMSPKCDNETIAVFLKLSMYTVQTIRQIVFPTPLHDQYMLDLSI